MHGFQRKLSHKSLVSKVFVFHQPTQMVRFKGQCRKLRTMTGHLGRVGTMAWNGAMAIGKETDVMWMLPWQTLFFFFNRYDI